MDIVSSNKDQPKFITITIYHYRIIAIRTYADAVVNIPDDPAVLSTMNELSRSRLDNITILTSEVLREIYDILISDELNVVDTSPPVLSTNTSISENTSPSCRTDGPRQVASKNNSVSRLDKNCFHFG